MNHVFEHIQQVRYLLYQLFESGFIFQRSIEGELGICQSAAKELGLAHGAALICALTKELTAFRAGQNTLGTAVLYYSNLISYYNMAAAMLMVENISAKAEQ